MKLGIISDLHLDHSAWPEFNPEDYSVDQWVNAGDIATNRLLFDYFTKKVLPDQFYIMGNHDMYGRDILNPAEYCKTLYKGRMKIAGAPLWTDLSNPLDWLKYKDGLIDYRFMSKHGWYETTYNEHHGYQKNFLLNSGADVIVSHHAPSYESVSPRFANDPYNCCFATELSENILMMKKPPKLWIHGHMHNSADYMIGKTRVICHPRGYPSENEFNNYRPLILDI